MVRLVSIIGTLNLVVTLSETAPTLTAADATVVASEAAAPQFGSRLAATPKIKRDSKAKVTSLELDSQETGYLPGGYQQSSADSDYGYDAGKNTYGKQASDWSVYDQGKLVL